MRGLDKGLYMKEGVKMEEDRKKRKFTLIITPAGKGKSKVRVIVARKGKGEGQGEVENRQLVLPLLFEEEGR